MNTELLQTSAANLDSICGQLPMAAALFRLNSEIDSSLNPIHRNQKFVDLFPFDSSFTSFITPKSAERFYQALKQSILENKAIETVVSLNSSTSERTDYSIHMHCIDRAKSVVLVTAIRKTPTALDSRDKKWWYTFKYSSDFIILADRNMKITEINKIDSSFNNIEVRGTDLLMFLPSEHHEKVTMNVKTTFEKRIATSYEVPVAAPDGSMKWYSSSVTPLMIDGEVEEVIIVSRDITENRRAEQALKDSERIFRSTCDSAPMSIALFDRDGKHVYFNARYAKLINYPTTETQRLSFCDIFRFEDDSDLHEAYQDLTLLKREALEGQASIRTKDGMQKDVHLSAVSMVYKSDNTVLFLAMMTDLTAQQQQLATIERQTAQMRLITNSVPALISYIDNKLTYQFVNKPYLKFNGLVRGELIGKHLSSPYSPETLERNMHHIENALAGKSSRFQFGVQESSGERRHYQIYLVPDVHSGDEKVRGFFSIIYDITDQKQKESVNLSAIMEAEDAERRRIALDLHDGLGQILFSMNLALKSMETQVHKAKSNIDPGISKMKQLLNTCSSEIRAITQNVWPYSIDEFNLELSIRNMAERITKHASIRFEVIIHELPESLSKPIQITLYRIAQELFTNALKHARAHTITFQMINHGDTITMMIEDDGIGMNEQDNFGGTGLRNIRLRLQGLEGKMSIDSTSEHGTSITIEIPLP